MEIKKIDDQTLEKEVVKKEVIKKDNLLNFKAALEKSLAEVNETLKLFEDVKEE